MSNELDDFLRHTAEIRQRKTIEQRSDAAFAYEGRARAQYSNARSEREVRSLQYDDDEIEPEILDGNEVMMAVEVDARDTTRLRSEDAKAPEHVHFEHGNHRANDGSNSVDTSSANVAIEGLKAMLKSPNGMRQAFLLREILDRPKF